MAIKQVTTKNVVWSEWAEKTLDDKVRDHRRSMGEDSEGPFEQFEQFLGKINEIQNIKVSFVILRKTERWQNSVERLQAYNLMAYAERESVQELTTKFFMKRVKYMKGADRGNSF